MTKSFQLKRILVPTDFSDLASQALGLARNLAQKTDAEVVVLYADPFLPPPHFTSTQLDEVVQAITHSKELAGTELDRYLEEQLGAGVKSRAVVVESMPVPAIVDWASGNEVDLIIMGTHGRSGFNRLMLGSVTERVLRETDQPLLAVRGEEGIRPLRKILCPVNFTGVAQKALDWAAGFSRFVGAELVLLHVAEDDEATDDELMSRFASCALPEDSGSAMSIEMKVIHGRADEKVIEFAKANEVDLIVLGAQHKTFFDATVLGATTIHVLRHASTPVVTVVAKE